MKDTGQVLEDVHEHSIGKSGWKAHVNLLTAMTILVILLGGQYGFNYKLPRFAYPL